MAGPKTLIGANVPSATHKHRDRRRTLKMGKIVFDRKQCVMDCTVRNLSDGGACLLLTSVIGIPSEFELAMGDVSWECSVAWKTANQIGVSFRPPGSSPVYS